MKKIYLGLLISLFSTAIHAQAFDLEWAKSMGGTLSDEGWSITTDALGNVFVAGSFQDTVDFDPGAAVFNLIANGSGDVFIQKLDAGGNFIWAKSMGGTSFDIGYSVTTDASGNVYVTGHYYNTVDFDPNIGIFTLVSNGFADFFIQKLDSGGNFIWAKSMGGTFNVIGFSITTDAAGHVYTTGSFVGTADFDPSVGTFFLTSTGYADVFIQKLDSSGNFIWAKSATGVGITPQGMGYSLATDASGSVYVTGFYSGTVDFDPNAGTFLLASTNGTRDVFVLKLDSSGNLNWVISMGGKNSDEGQSIATDASGNVYTTGYYGDTVDFDPGMATFNLISKGGSDVFIQKLSQCAPNTGTDVITACDSYTWIDGNTYTSSNNTATDTLTNAGGCDSVVTLGLTITNSTTGTDVFTACDSFTWIDGNTYTSSNNTATDTLSNTAGCDSVVTLNLTITNSTTYTDVVAACDSLTWIDGNTYNSNNNTATYTLTNSAGCDSVVSLNLTIGNINTGDTTAVACGSFTWYGTTYTNSDTPTYNLTNAGGCDSVVTLHLTVNSVNTSVTQTGVTLTADASGAAYQWMDCANGFALFANDTNQSFTATSNGSYAVEITENGCVDTSSCYAITTLGLNERSFQNNLIIYPNPTTGNFSIDLGRTYENTIITITDVLGRVVSVSTYNQSQLISQKFEGQAAIYFLQINSGDKGAIVKLVKMD